MENKSTALLQDRLPIKTDVSIRVRGYDTNIDQKLITVTEDKVQLCLDRHLKKVGKKRWMHPLSLTISLLLALATSEFNKLSWVSSELLRATFIVASVVTTGWLIWEIMNSAQLRHLHEIVEDIFDELRGTNMLSQTSGITMNDFV